MKKLLVLFLIALSLCYGCSKDEASSSKLTVSPTTFELNAEGGLITIQANFVARCEIQADDNFKIESKYYRGDNPYYYDFVISANGTSKSRTATISVTDLYGNSASSVQITQSANTDNELNINTQGSLEKSVVDNGLFEAYGLKITGTIGAVDLLYLRSMPNLIYLDLSETDLTELAANVFKASNLTTIILPNSLQVIKEEAFAESALESINIPASVRIIESGVFSTCTNLYNVTFAPNSNLTTIGSEGWSLGVFYKCTALDTIIIPASVEVLGYSAFEESWLRKITFEKGSKLRTITGGTFYNTLLSEITIPANVEILAGAAFNKCDNLTEIRFEPQSKLKQIVSGFSQRYDLQLFDASNCAHIENVGAFYQCGLTQFKIGTSTPPTCEYSATISGKHFDVADYAVLQVPKGCIDAYKSQRGWNEFSSVSELE